MSLDHAILGFLSYAPFTGYDLKKVFDASIRHFWPADQAQIYRTLTRLAERGWAEVEVIPQAERPDRKLYRITERGREELLGWLRRPLPRKEIRESELVQVFFGGLLPDEEVLSVLEQRAAAWREMRERLRRVPVASEYTAKGSAREVFFWLLTLENGLAMTEAALAWLESVIARIRAKDYRLNLAEGGMPDENPGR